MLEYYTDVIVDELAEKLNGLSGVTVWGGSSFSRLRELFHAGESGVLPFVFVSTQWEVAQGNRKYTVMNSSGEIATRLYDDSAVPILYNPSLEVCGKTQQEVEELVNALRSLYADGVMRKASIPGQPEEEIPLFVRISDQDVEIEPRGGLSKKPSPIECFNASVDFYPAKTPKPLLISAVDFGELKRDRYIQYRFVQIAQWCNTIANPRLIESWLEDYHSIVDPSRSPNNCSDDFLALRRMSKRGETPSREAFESCLKVLIPVCPDLFERYTSKEPYFSTATYIMDKTNRIDQLKHRICDHLDLPEHVDMHIQSVRQPREGEAFRYYLQYMDEDSSVSIRDAYHKYRRRLFDKEKHDIELGRQTRDMVRNLLERETPAYHEEPHYEPTSSSASLGGSIVGSILGNAIGNYGERKELRRQTRLMEEADKRDRRAEEREKRADEERRRAEEERRRRMRYEYNRYIHDMGTASGRKKWEGRTPPPFPGYS